MDLSKSSLYPFKPLRVKNKRTGEIVLIKDYRFNEEIHEKLGYVEAPEQEEKNSAAIVKESINESMTRRELEQVASQLGLKVKDINACTNKAKLVEAIHNKLSS